MENKEAIPELQNPKEENEKEEISKDNNNNNKVNKPKEKKKAKYIPTQIGEVFVFGKSFDGQLGLPKIKDSTSVPQHLSSLSGLGIRKLACGLQHCIALCENGDTYGLI